MLATSPSYSRRFTAAVFSALLAATASAQSEIRIEPPQGGGPAFVQWLTRPYRPRTVPAVNLSNSSRLDSLIRGGNLYVSARDVIALAIENNLDIEVQRYAPLLAKEVLLRAQGGGALRSVGLGVAAGPQSVSLQGVTVNATGAPLSAGAGVSSGGGIVTQLGPSIPSLDPTLVTFANFQHATTPQSNTQLTGTTTLVQNTRSVQAVYSQNWDFGLNAQLTFSSNHIHINSAYFAINPYFAGNLDLQVTQNLLNGFGRAVNGRNIQVQKNNQKVSDLQFQQQVITTVSAVLNLYWDLVAFRQDLESRQRELATARQLLEDNRRQVELGALAEIEITRAQAQVYSAQQDLLVSQTNLLQQETVLKNALVRGGVAQAGLSSVHVIPLDRIALPAQEETTPLEQLVRDALDRRLEVAQDKINIDSNKKNLVGIKSSLKPQLQAFAELTNNGLSGSITPFGALEAAAIDNLVGGFGNYLGQIFRRNYPNYSAGFSLNIPIRNRAAQSDFATSQLELRQNELNLQKTESQIAVDVQNALIGLQQARARYEASLHARELQQETAGADQRKYELGATTAYQVMQDQRDLANAVTTEVEALANYTHARIALDQALGRTLDVNDISIAEARTGRISRESRLPANLPTEEPK
ncbi:MAG: TolC family protein [Bryobacterales bacterium]|nr:TolC family protein [Bryobacterales bacterium]MBV9401369.1 TolC family protein [Bryobacterales bacterium]